MLHQTQLQHILHFYGLTAKSFLTPEKGYRNHSHPVVLRDGTQVNLIVYKNEPGILPVIRAAHAVAAQAAHAGIPCRLQADPRILTIKSGGEVRYAALYVYLPGHTIPWDGYTMKHLKAVGEMLSNLHASLSNFAPPVALESVIDTCLALTQRMESYFIQEGVQKALSEKLDLRIHPALFGRYSHILTACRQLKGGQPLHMDFVRGNILFDDSAQITGVLDFEKTAHGPPIFDIARTYAFLLIDIPYKSEEKLYKYFITSGYNKRGKAHFSPIRFEGAPLLDELVRFYLLYDFYKFLRHNPYESLPLNDHFVRTGAYLVRCGLIDGKIPL